MTKVTEALARILAIDPSAQAVEYAPGKWWTFGDLARLTDSLIEGFDAGGLPDGARVGILFRNRPQQLAALLACVLDGKCAVAVNPLLPGESLRDDVRTLRLAMLVGAADDLVSPGLVAVARELGAGAMELPDGKGIATIVPGLGGASPEGRETSPGVLIEMLTSGTTGAPKRVPLTARSFDMSFEAAVEALESRRGDEGPRLRTGIRILTAPLSHISGISGALMTLAAGRKLALLEKFDVNEFLAAIVRLRPKLVNAPPAALRMMLDAGVSAEQLSSVTAIRTGTAPLDPAIADEFLERHDIPVLQTYGATEFAGAVAGWSLSDFRKYWREKRGSVGRVLSGVSARIVDPNAGAELACGEEGLLELSGSQLGRGEWIRTTDRAMIDAEGFLFIRGRSDGAIIRGGFKVHAEDVIKVVEQHPFVREAAVVGLSDRRLGEVPVCAFIPVSGAHPPSSEELKTFLRTHLLPYQVPTEFLAVEDLPRTPSMKPSLPAVRALFSSRRAEEIA
jgi:long-chain acyl-CoA synthetase